MNKKKALDYIQTHNLIGIKAGADRSSFLEIWMVVINDRIFARSWGLAEKSWYNSFLQNPKGQIQCGNLILNINTRVPTDNDALTDAINNAYLTKYNSEHNMEYAKGIIQTKHIEKTMEFIIDES
ncbi:DUF2255 family protein [Chryseobacterium polytrichastri]|uniref:DUF2255 family protein n=1 Tax=Chryseobacterium polytrichastri TaxID=1302687 RepID=A0A1M6PR17_9FLAO|nr:DUF2255 family protein [Chryseobacterium polytrichastri]SHK10308.1 hypothetical protein SAMN05444267_100185 [Chryseobacterium polytrichastri]